MLSLPDAARSLRSGESSLDVYLGEVLETIAAVEPTIHSLLPEPGRADRLRREAAALQRAYPRPAERPPLFGVVVGVKDIFHVDGLPTAAGSRLPPEALAGPEAKSVRRLRRAGVLVLGKTVTTEFAYFAPGPTRNPRNPEHTPGGSSSGSAAAVAAGLCPLALGTQTIGSIVRPASFCGVVGFKPSFRRVPSEGVFPLAPSLDHVGFFTRDASGAAYAAAVLCDGWKPEAVPPAPVLAVPVGPYLDRAEDVARAHFERALDALRGAGFDVRQVAVMADFDEVVARHQVILAAEAAQVHAELFRSFGHLYHDQTARLVSEGQRISRQELAAARDGQALFRRQIQSAMEESGVHLWLAPSTVGPAPRGLESTGDPILNLPWTQAGLPTMSLPCGLDGDGLPLGLQLVAGWYQDERLAAWAPRIEAVVTPARLAIPGTGG